MRAVVADHPGPPEVLRPVELPDPDPGPGQVAIAVTVAAITFIDTQLRAGTVQGQTASFPVVLGNGVGGIVTGIGDHVDPGWIGTEVVSSVGGRGGYATRALALIADLHRVPTGLDLKAATALLADGRTAVGLARAAHIEAGDTVAITAAAGGVGGLLVQLAHHAETRVIALASDERKLAHARALGADIAINYRDTDWRDQLRDAAPHGLDVVFNGVGGDTTPVLFNHVRSGGRYLPHGAASGSWGELGNTTVATRDITIVPLDTIGASADDLFHLVEEALALAAAGTIHPTIGQAYPLERAADAHRAIEARTTLGKTLLFAPPAASTQHIAASEPSLPVRLGMIIGSTREGRFGPTVATWLAEQARRFGDVDVDVIDLAEADLPHVLSRFGTSPVAEVAALGVRLAAADAFAVITPEYNHSFPAALKNAIDHYRDEWKAKPVALVSYGGMAGGLRAAEHLRLVFAELHSLTIRNTVSFHHAHERFDDAGNPIDAAGAAAAAANLFRQLVWWARLLRIARANDPYPG
jgi:NADPH2:quinone reductase